MRSDLDPKPEHWIQAWIVVFLYFLLLAFCDHAPAATLPKESTMSCKYSPGPNRAIIADHSGYTTIHDPAGRMIGAATSGDGLPRKTIEANGRLFAAAATLHSALTRYFDVTDKAFVSGFTAEITATLTAARQQAMTAFAIVEGESS
ncbi:MAG: hypothetical protein PHQ05_05085 [Sterolibacterium sp.]|nr:hypothetical protein [Sterolibacterium sp.]